MTELTNQKIIDQYKELLLEIEGINKAEHIKTMESAVSTAWGAEPWDEMMISRDILQNFRDSCVEAKVSINKIKVSTKDDLIKVFAPTFFSLKKLFYIGSTKTESEADLIGQNGEGAKKCYCDLYRRGIQNPINISGEDALIIGIGKEDKDTGLRPLVYHFFKINKQPGCFFIVKTISKKLKNAFDFGMRNFFHSTNELLGQKLHEHNDIELYTAKTKNGYGFYRGLKRIEIKDIPVIINIKKPYAALEKKTKMDRDRNAFSDKLQTTFFSIFSRSGFYSMEGNDAIYYILRKSKSVWKKGHPLLSSIASHSYSRLKDDPEMQDIFGKEYISESKFRYSTSISWSDWYSTNTQGYILKRDKQQKKKKIMLPSYFSSFGVESSLDSFIRNKTNTEKRIKNTKTKDLSTKQRASIDFCFKAIKEISPSFSKLFDKSEDENLYEVKFKSIKCKDLLGQLKDDSSTYNNKLVYLHVSLFKGSFGKMLSTFMHELGHATGSRDGERNFSDLLTFMLQQALDKNSKVGKFSKEWERGYRLN
jgi:hypothetical protein